MTKYINTKYIQYKSNNNHIPLNMLDIIPLDTAWSKYCCKSQTFKLKDMINEILLISVVLGKFLGLNQCTF